MKSNVLKSGLKAATGITGSHLRWLFFLALATIILSSCYTEPWYGRNGRPGDAFLSITWIDAQPEYIDAGTGDIPPVFQYGRYYRSWPGFYTLYYDGRIWNGQANVFYAWEVDYEIWEVSGEPGELYYNGLDGADNYFTVECSPYGPWVYGPGYKSAELPEGYELKESSDDKIIIEKESSNFGITLTYRKVAKRNISE
ncbi:MAG: hypothetical protein KAT76_02095 [Bacteroidales bacterium]|nr:hypothetical protein [Bacteroidales bacterium]